VRVYVIVRPPPLYLGNNGRQDTEPAPDPLVLRTEPEFPGDPGRKWQRTDFAEIVRQEIFIHRVRIDLVPGLPDPDNAGSTRFEDKKIVPKVRVFICLPAVAHLLRELFCFVNCSGRFFPPGHFLMVGVGGLKGLWLGGGLTTSLSRTLKSRLQIFFRLQILSYVD
jgi:hypothetical protein